MKNYAWILVIAACALCGLPDKSGRRRTPEVQSLPPIPLSLNEVHVDRSLPSLLKGRY